MKIIKSRIKTVEMTGNQRGVVAVIVLMILLGVSVLALNTMLNSHMNQSSSNNYKHRLQTFYAADGLMTLLAQEMIDTSESKYLKNNMSDLDIGGPIAGSHRYDSLKNTDTIKASGTDIWGSSDQFNFFYTRVKGDMDLCVKVISIINPFTWTKAGIMIREKLTGSSKYVYVLRPFNCGMGIRYQYRDNFWSIDSDSTLTPKPDAYWIRLKRVGNTFSGYRSADGSSWTLIYQKSIPLTDSVYAGLAVTSHNSDAVSTAVFSNFEGISRASCSDSTFIGKDSISVKYTIDRTGSATFQMKTDAYKLKGSTRIPIFNTVLNQKIARERTDVWSLSAHDSVFIPVTFYEMRSDMSNPEFNVNAWPTRDISAHYIKTDVLTSDRKPIKKDPDLSFKNCFISFWDPAWYNKSAAERTTIANNRNWPRTTEDPCFDIDPTWSWCFNDSMHTWFKPWGDSTGKTGSYSYDYLSGRWYGLKVRPGWAPIPGNNDTEWVTTHWNSANPFANIVLYDTLKFLAEPHPNEDVFTFGKDKSDPRWFLLCKEGTGCNYWSLSRFMPLQNKGFGFDCPGRYTVDSCNISCFLKQNFAFTMEFHRTFTYKSGQFFNFDGDDDVFVFIDNRCVINLGGIHAPQYASVKLDTLRLTEGKSYMFDFFYCERCIWGSDILITTNMLSYNPPQGTKRSWKRDYGRLD
jgi:fibro-slime domain-containing protein